VNPRDYQRLTLVSTQPPPAPVDANDYDEDEDFELQSLDDNDLMQIRRTSTKSTSGNVSSMPRLKTRRVMVSNFPPRIRERDILRLFSQYGVVRDISLKPVKDTAICYILFSRSREASAAVQRMQGYQIAGFRLVVELVPRLHPNLRGMLRSSAADDYSVGDYASVSTISGVTRSTDENEMVPPPPPFPPLVSSQMKLTSSVKSDVGSKGGLSESGKSLFSLQHLFSGSSRGGGDIDFDVEGDVVFPEDADIESGRAAGGASLKSVRSSTRELVSVKEQADRESIKVIKQAVNDRGRINRRCKKCPRLWTGGLYMLFTCCFINPCGLYMAVQSGLIYLILYPVCIFECIFWILIHAINAFFCIINCCCFGDSGGGINGSPTRCAYISRQIWEIVCYFSLFVTMCVPLLPMWLATSAREGDWEASRIPTLVGPLSPLRLTLLTTLGEDKNYQRVSLQEEGWRWLR